MSKTASGEPCCLRTVRTAAIQSDCMEVMLEATALLGAELGRRLIDIMACRVTSLKVWRKHGARDERGEVKGTFRRPIRIPSAKPFTDPSKTRNVLHCP